MSCFLLSRIGRDRHGAAMVELALLAVPLVLLVLGTINTLLVTTARASLDTTLQAHAYDLSNADASAFPQAISRSTFCNRSTIFLVSCTDPAELCFAILPLDALPPRLLMPMACQSGSGFAIPASGTYALIVEYQVPPYLDLYNALAALLPIRAGPTLIRAVALAYRP